MIKFQSAFLILLTILTGCFDLSGGGENTLVKECKNARGDKKAILFLKESGAMAGDSYHVSILTTNHDLNRSEIGNTFTMDTNNGKTFLDSNSINLSWLSADTLLIEYDRKLRTFLQKRYVNGTAILYQLK